MPPEDQQEIPQELQKKLSEKLPPTKAQNLNFATEISDAELKDVFDYHPWTPEQIAKGTTVREALAQAFKAIVENVPPSADRSAALRKIREARMDANSAITHGGKY
jgi:hypothetical protein